MNINFGNIEENPRENQSSPKLVLHNKSRDIFDFQSEATAPLSVATIADTSIITETLDFHNFWTVSFRNVEGDRSSPEVVLHNKSRNIFDLQGGATVPLSVASIAGTLVITETFNFHNFWTVSFRNFLKHFWIQHKKLRILKKKRVYALVPIRVIWPNINLVKIRYLCGSVLIFSYFNFLCKWWQGRLIPK